MSLDTIAAQFVEISGRPDLEPGGSSTVDAYWYINQAQRMLDRYLSDGKAVARYAVDVEAGQILVPIYGCRAVKEVYIVDATKRTRLSKIDVQTLRSWYPNPKANLDADKPIYYCPIASRRYPKSQTSSDVTYTWILEEILDSSKRNSYNAILIEPPPDVTYTIEVWGLWYTESLSKGADVSYWTEEHPDILLNAALYKLEVHYRNTEGAKDWKGAVDLDMAELMKDFIEEETADISQMRG